MVFEKFLSSSLVENLYTGNVWVGVTDRLEKSTVIQRPGLWLQRFSTRKKNGSSIDCIIIIIGIYGVPSGIVVFKLECELASIGRDFKTKSTGPQC